MKMLITLEEAIKGINKGKLGIFEVAYGNLAPDIIRWAQHKACQERKIEVSLTQWCREEARRVPRFCKELGH